MYVEEKIINGLLGAISLATAGRDFMLDVKAYFIRAELSARLEGSTTWANLHVKI